MFQHCLQRHGLEPAQDFPLLVLAPGVEKELAGLISDGANIGVQLEGVYRMRRKFGTLTGADLTAR